ncbi:MAG: sulfotransferase family 2 domain-containing protein [Pseudomonadota bacterium]
MVMICHPYEFIFLKTRKTAGTSIEMYLEPLCTPDGHEVVEKTHTMISKRGIVGRRLIPPADWTEDDRKWYNHMPARNIAALTGEDMFYGYRKVISVRNPFDRMVSAFAWAKSDKAKDLDFSQIKRRFRKFMQHKGKKTDRKIVTYQSKHVADFAVRYEHLHDDLKMLKTKLGLPGDLPPLPTTKSTSSMRKSYPVADYYDPDTIDIVHKDMAWVFENYDYPDKPT